MRFDLLPTAHQAAVDPESVLRGKCNQLGLKARECTPPPYLGISLSQLPWFFNTSKATRITSLSWQST